MDSTQEESEGGASVPIASSVLLVVSLSTVCVCVSLSVGCVCERGGEKQHTCRGQGLGSFCVPWVMRLADSHSIHFYSLSHPPAHTLWSLTLPGF